MTGGGPKHNQPLQSASIGVSQKGSREWCLPVSFCPENETEENGKTEKKNKEKMGKKKQKKGIKKKQWKRKQAEKKHGRKRKKTEKIESDTVPATPFAKSRFKPHLLNPHLRDSNIELACQASQDILRDGRRTSPNMSCASKKCRILPIILGHARTEKDTVKVVIWRAEGAIIESAFSACFFGRVGAALKLGSRIGMGSPMNSTSYSSCHA